MGKSAKGQATIARIWRGRTKREVADRYAPYLYEEGIKPLEEGAWCPALSRGPQNRDGIRHHFLLESVEAMSNFAGGDPTQIHHLDRDAEFLIELPDRVQILSIVAASGNSGGNRS